MEILELILSDKANRMKHIKQFQTIIWNEDDPNQILADLAHDLDYYEPDKEIRREDPSFYGDEQLEEEVKAALDKLASK